MANICYWLLAIGYRIELLDICDCGAVPAMYRDSPMTNSQCNNQQQITNSQCLTFYWAESG